ncbi:hypothetical protein M2459_001250 [Parabacteroides sp. PF5-5]|uniref:CotH kinase family protein n=1 Tax=unclassified Parabacteroides TaxID=2649774 RepID=UPI0024753FE1|nr:MULTISPECIES: CotH kinase family protein [unclassified Parabacteroides]MDH6304517.1 hypothetical protein [Parabacteroides sp. PH5-39]MDH6315331.1 hypothetical protein [Parabacteroides sp. PF5-13]MDH6319175.1 hypothetical protein [Parabacteroides sp. PH5-13]MDH6322906.1 hypothetical protein [Parabacteroides sp. PH5-8]MDH6326522.1 hypothetical protein [Parabacteroides sp. PH5-41]
MLQVTLKTVAVRCIFCCVFLFSGLLLFTAQAVNDPLYPYHPGVSLPFTSSNLPIVCINLDQRMADKSADKRVSASMRIIWNKDGSDNHVSDTGNDDYNGKIGIKYRGNSSFWNSDKKPFGIRIQDSNGKKQKASILGMPEDEDWALLAPFSDKSLIRDVLLFDLMRGAMDYVPTGRYCEVVLNGVYQGVYIMTARVRQGSNRVNIKAPTADDGDGVTGGYHLEIDRSDEPGFWGVVNTRGIRNNVEASKTYYQYKYPDEEDLSTAQKNYIQSLVKEMERAIESDNFKNAETGYRAYLDTLSLVNFFLAQEISKNMDGYRLSTPLYKYPNSIDKRFKFSIWDFNISMGNINYIWGWSPEGWSFNGNVFSEDNRIPWMFKRILQDEQFYDNLKNKWAEYRKNRFSDEQITTKIDSLTNLLQESQVRNFTIWNRFNREVWPNYYISSSWNDELSYLKKWLLNRVGWMDSQWIQEEINLVANGNMEAASTRGYKNDTWLSEWSSTGTAYLTTTNVNNGSYALSLQSYSRAYQVVTELTPGKYTLRVWAKTSSELNTSVYYAYNKDKSNHTAIKTNIEGNNNYHLIEIKDIDVSNNFVEIGVETQSSKDASARLWIDDVEFVKQKEAVGNIPLVKETGSFRIVADKQQMELRISSSNNEVTGQHIEIYEISGGKVYHSRLTSGQQIIRGIFAPHKVYIVRVGDTSKKVIF